MNISFFSDFFLPYQIAFIQSHHYLTEAQISQIREILYFGDSHRDSLKAVADYEKQMAALIGPGYGISFAAGRMAFFTILKVLGIGKGDEVILPGFTCSVMANAVWRAGSIPVFADIDIETLGSGAQEIEKKITPRTRMIVAQHSFGIPCGISDIVKLGKKYGIFVLEDSAITLDSSVNGIPVGNWADAAIFSTDHTKPLNTLIGGFLYTANKALYDRIRLFCEPLTGLSKAHQERLYNQFIFERINFEPKRYPRTKIISRIRNFIKKPKIQGSPVFLEADYKKNFPSDTGYPYPARMPPFLSKLGIFELERWNKEKRRRKELLNEYIKIATQAGFGSHLPKAYFNSSLDIVPLRFAFQHRDAAKIKHRMSRFIDIEGIWFQTPIICCPDGPQSLGYRYGNCPISEDTCKRIINWPCVIHKKWEASVLENFRNLINRIVNR